MKTVLDQFSEAFPDGVFFKPGELAILDCLVRRPTQIKTTFAFQSAVQHLAKDGTIVLHDVGSVLAQVERAAEELK